MSPRPRWTAAQDAELARRWDASEPTAVIAVAMGLASKNVVIGRAYRLGLARRQAAPVKPTRPRPLPTGCLWPLWDLKSDGRFCDAPRVDGKSYCAEHCRVAYVPATGKRESNPRGFVLTPSGRSLRTRP